MRSGSRIAVAAALLIGSVPATALRAQEVSGHVYGPGRRPLSSALVELQRLDGTTLQRVLSSATGGFLLTAPAPGAYRYRVAAIGYRPLAATPITVPAAGVIVPDVTLQAVSVRLPDLVAVAGNRFCGRQRANADIFDGFLQAAHTALDVMETSVTSHVIAFTVARIDSRSIYGAYTTFETADTTIQPLARWPIQSIDLDTLRIYGFGRLLQPGNENSREYYGPDARVLFSSWFLDSHCFTIDKPNRKHPSDSLHLRFTPARKSKLIDIAGELVLDAHTLALLQMSFEHQNLPKWMSVGQAGGNMEFSPMPSGLWVTRTWQLWAPLGGQSPDGHMEVRGEVERYGWVIQTFEGDSARARQSADTTH